MYSHVTRMYSCGVLVTIDVFCEQRRMLMKQNVTTTLRFPDKPTCLLPLQTASTDFAAVTSVSYAFLT